MIKISVDGVLDIATANSRKSTNWRNREWKWSELVKKLSVTHYTHETVKEYFAMKKPDQDAIKDIGGFVGGMVSQGRRKAANITFRQLITLDLDYATPDFWWDFANTLYPQYAACVYSTHKHTSGKPRLRLVLPLDRPVTPDEYQAISRRIAGQCGIELFDPTTFQPERLMYWPSTSKDGDYFFEPQDGKWLSADEVLSSYHDWKDTSQWPVCPGERDAVVKKLSKQEDPTVKLGLVGAFCRTYDIHQAIETFLSDVYEACDEDNRYTYKAGSAAGGVVTYDDKYAYSHHATDPAGGLLCNAFDLVRVHLYGDKDAGKKEHTPGNKLASYDAMAGMVSGLDAVKEQLHVDRLKALQEEFAGVPENAGDEVAEDVPDTENADFVKLLQHDKKGNVVCTIDNILKILLHDSYLKDKIGYDDFEKCEVATGNLPWRKVSRATRRLTDIDDAAIQHYLERQYNINSVTKYRTAMQVLSNRKTFHPVKDYLKSLVWDGKCRVDDLLIDYMGAEGSEYTRAVTRKALVAAVARIMQPGIKFDYVLTLVGPEGKGKSTLFATLGQDWFSDSFSLHTVGTKESFEQLQGVWVIEIAELAGMAKKEVEIVKGFITKRVDRYRVAFGRRTEDFPRQCVFFATTNKQDFLKENNGNRRFWPVQILVEEPVKRVDKHLTEAETGQIWAEAMRMYQQGEKLYLPEKLQSEATAVQQEHTEVHPWTHKINAYLELPLPEEWDKMSVHERYYFVQTKGADHESTVRKPRMRVCVDAIWEECIGGNKAPIDERAATVIRHIMTTNKGWKEEPKPARFGVYGLIRKGYLRINSPHDPWANKQGYDSSASVFLN